MSEGTHFPARITLPMTMPLIFFLADFDECSVYGTCSQLCTNTDGSFTCGCVEGYLLQPDNRSCKAKNGGWGHLWPLGEGALSVVPRWRTACEVLGTLAALTLLSSIYRAGRPAPGAADCQLSKHPGHVPEWGPSVYHHAHQHTADHSHGLQLRQRDCVLGARRGQCRPDAAQVCPHAWPEGLRG